LETKRSAF